MDKRKRTTDRTTVQPPAAKPAPTQAPSNSGRMPVWDQDRLLKICGALHGIGGALQHVDGSMETDVVNGLGSAFRLLAWDLEEIHEGAAYKPAAAEGGAK
ncbi:MAG: hypothetical protein NTW68_05325 [candidate division NC10 bacterium]|nr:hypothetical protein [candidate division NC10 bacterium]